MITAANIQRVVDECDREMIVNMVGCDACDVEIVRFSCACAVEHFQRLVSSGHPLEHATRTAARCAARAAVPGIAESNR
jgi:hypothetical protein